MSDILQKILAFKKSEVAKRKSINSISSLEKSRFFNLPRKSLRKNLERAGQHGIIAEIKRKSPSKGILHEEVDAPKLAVGYENAGAAALSILTDEKFFGGSGQDITEVREIIQCPILRKDFIIDEYQLYEARAMGADVILLIAAALSPQKYETLIKLAQMLELEILLEVHNAEEISTYVNEDISFVGVNNRNLKTFETNIDNSLKLSEYLPKGIIWISESGITSVEDIIKLRAHGYRGFLIGETFMKAASPEEACRKLIQNLNHIKYTSHA